MTVNDKKIHIVYALDDNYTELTCVSMASMLYNTKRNIHFHVIESTLSDENKAILASLKDRFPHGEWSFHHFEIPNEKDFSVEKHITVATYLKLFVPDILPELSRVIYIDGDTVIERDIEKLWNVDLEDKVIGAVADNFINLYNDKILRSAILGLKKNDIYFNSGIIVFDLKKLRPLNLLEELYEEVQRFFLLYKKCGLAWYPEQELLNYLLKGKIKFLSMKFNFQVHVHALYHYGVYNSYVYDLKSWIETFVSPVIIHFLAADKPSKLDKFIPLLFWERYYVYKAMTPYADVENDTKRIVQHHVMEENSFIENVPSFFKLKWYPLFIETADKLKENLNGKKLALWGAGVHTSAMMVVFASRGVDTYIIVDGTENLQGTKLFNYTVQTPEILYAMSDKYYVLLSMEQKAPAAEVSKILKSYGYDEEQFSHVYKPLWDIVNESTL